ncbi:MAG: hypothetical protein DWQ35_17305 [Planctomycetota bacterium]|nr:MAG: hypothetical protein DWQ35_17305 [Planctomycetota bacterium]REK28208.1 MAG: hypothetical protein DWQ42_05690 [Planctomycetota bacterium]REK42466.1 MAG: hypothetical protein DWQ46_13330 [Planctomycetota bacterium]
MTTAQAELSDPVVETPSKLRTQRLESSRDLTEYCDSRGVAVRVDRQKSRINGVKILGTKSRNGRTYRPDALESAVELYEGAPVNVNHPKGHPASPRDYQDRIGRIENVAFRSGQGLFGDFHFNPKHPLVEQLLWDAENAPENVGFSHNVQARVVQEKKQLAVEAITKVNSVDLVAEPATTSGLFEAKDRAAKGKIVADARVESASLSLREATRADLEQLRPDLVEQLQATHATELAELREELDRLRASEAVAQKRASIGALLDEFKLPPPGSSDPLARAITSDHFVESLLTAPNETVMRGLLEERAALAKHVRYGGATGGPVASRPLCREPQDVEAAVAQLDTPAFVSAIT